MSPGLLTWLKLSWRLQLRSRQALLFGFGLPLVFLLAFAALYRHELPPLAGRMGQWMTITLLGSTCFGLPTALVAERERGLWRRFALVAPHRLLLVGGSLVARWGLALAGLTVQGALALALGMPAPAAPLLLLLAAAGVAASFLGLGLLLARWADTVPAVQLLGQCLFLPLLIFGGVAVPLEAMPAWVQEGAHFLPGQAAVEWLQRAAEGQWEWTSAGTVGAMGLSAGLGGAVGFRWEPGPRRAVPWGWPVGALLVWSLAGVWALWAPAGEVRGPLPRWSEGQIEAIDLSRVPADTDLVAPMAPPFGADGGGPEVQAFLTALAAWTPAQGGGVEREVRAVLSLIGLADLVQDPRERQLARAAYVWLRARHKRETLRQVLMTVLQAPDRGWVLTQAPELGVRRAATAEAVRQRVDLYARKFLGKLEGRLPE